MSHVDLLRKVSIFRDLDDASLQGLDRLCRVKSYDREAVVVSEDERGEALFVVAEGQTKAVLYGPSGREVILALKAAADGTLDQPIRGVGKLKAVAKAFGLDLTDKTTQALAGEVAAILLEDLSRTIPGEHRTLAAMAPPERRARWADLDILPIGGYHEVYEALHRTGVGTDSDWRNLMDQFLRTGLAFTWSSVVGSAVAMDILYGLPKRSRVATNFGTLDETTVNIAIHGHSPVLATAIVEVADEAPMKQLAAQAGAAGIKFYGICCSGLSALYRHGEVHPLANAVAAELALGTGAIDLWVADVQDVYPGIMDVAKCFHTIVISTSDSNRLPGAVPMGFDHAHGNLSELREQARRIVRMAIDNHPRRRAGNVYIPQVSVDAEIGFGVENIIETFGGVAPLLAHLKAGRIKGVVNLVGCNNPKVLYEKGVAEVADLLLAHDMLVLTNGCASFPLLKLGYCLPDALAKAGPGLREALGPLDIPPVLHMGECLDNARASGLFRALADAAGEPIHRMPFAFCSPEWSNEKGVGAALSFRLMGLDSYHCVPAPVSGSETVRDFLDQGTRDLLGGGMVVVPEPTALAARMIEDLGIRRNGLSWA